MLWVLIRNSPRLKPSRTKKFIQGAIKPSPLIDVFNKSAPYVNGRMYETGLINAGRFCTGMNKPHKNTMGKRKKFENVWASKTSLTATEMNNPRKVEVTAIRITLNNTVIQFTPDKSIMNEAKIAGISAFKVPKNIAPVVLANIKRFKLMGASNNLSKERLLRSKVMVTASIEVVPNSTDKDMTPGRISLISTALFDFRREFPSFCWLCGRLSSLLLRWGALLPA